MKTAQAAACWTSRTSCHRRWWCVAAGAQQRHTGGEQLWQCVFKGQQCEGLESPGSACTSPAHTAAVSAAPCVLPLRPPSADRPRTHCVGPYMQADLNGDGKPEIITATPEGDIRVLAPRKAGDGFAQALQLSGGGWGWSGDTRW